MSYSIGSEPDPFGAPVVASGNSAYENPFRFSTKYQGDESSLIYYGYRYLSPGVGRWTRRDPAQEEGGLNLHGFVLNSPAGGTDPLGLRMKPEGCTLGAQHTRYSCHSILAGTYTGAGDAVPVRAWVPTARCYCEMRNCSLCCDRLRDECVSGCCYTFEGSRVIARDCTVWSSTVEERHTSKPVSDCWLPIKTWKWGHSDPPYKVWMLGRETECDMICEARSGGSHSGGTCGSSGDAEAASSRD